MTRAVALPAGGRVPLAARQQTRSKADKAFATIQACAALAGVQLVRSTDDRGREVFVGSQWALTAQFETLPEVAAWLQQVEELAS